MNSFGVTTIFIILLIICLSLVWWIFLQSKNKLTTWEKKGTIIFKLDPITGIVSPYKINQNNTNKSKLTSWIKPQYKNTPSNNLKLFGLVVNTREGDKFYREILNEVNNGKESIDYVFTIKNMRSGREKLTIDFHCLLRKIVDVSDYLIVMKWKVIALTKVQTNIKKIVPIEQVINNKARFKGFVTFDLNERIPFVQDKLIKEISSFLIRKNYDIFNASNLLIVTCYANKYKKIKKKVTKLIKYIENKINKVGIAQFIDGSGSARLTNISNKKEMYKTLATLDFLTNLSLRWKEPFIDIRTAQTFKQEFITYNEAAKKFRDLVRLHNFKTKFLAVKNRKTQRKVVDYCVPDLESFDKYEIKNILLSENNRKQLTDANLEKMLQQTQIEETLLIDVNGTWLLQNSTKLKLGKLHYIVRIDNYTFSNEISNLILRLIGQGFAIGIRLDSFSQFLITLIEKIKPSIVIIDEKIIEEKSLNDTLHYTKLLSLKNILEAIDIKVIFENLTPQITHQTANKLGINFYFNY